MNICLIGHGIPCLILANILSNKNIKISIFDDKNYKNKFNTRTLGITKNSIDFLKKQKINLKNNIWSINNIKIFNESHKDKEIFNFGPVNDNLFSIVKYSQFIDLLKKKTNKNKLIKIIKNKKKTFFNSILEDKHDFDLVINFDENNKISKELFFRREDKNYNSFAYTALINHKKIDNQLAYQVFTNIGPVAFLPCSNNETSIVFSVIKKSRNLDKNEIINLINKYNYRYLIKSFSKLEKFDLKGSLLKNYYYKKILCFGNNAHKIHPLAGQGLNMTIRDIKKLSDIIDNKIDLGLPLDQSILNEFENQTKHFNYLYAHSVNFIYEFFKFDNYFNNDYSNKLSNYFENNLFFKKYLIRFGDRGFI